MPGHSCGVPSLWRLFRRDARLARLIILSLSHPASASARPHSGASGGTLRVSSLQIFHNYLGISAAKPQSSFWRPVEHSRTTGRGRGFRCLLSTWLAKRLRDGTATFRPSITLREVRRHPSRRQSQCARYGYPMWPSDLRILFHAPQ